jgi:hypothetical protein
MVDGEMNAEEDGGRGWVQIAVAQLDSQPHSSRIGSSDANAMAREDWLQSNYSRRCTSPDARGVGGERRSRSGIVSERVAAPAKLGRNVTGSRVCCHRC